MTWDNILPALIAGLIVSLRLCLPTAQAADVLDISDEGVRKLDANKVAWLDLPRSGSIVDGFGLITGWACEAKSVAIRFDDGPLQTLEYGSSLYETATICGKDQTGFFMDFNYNDISKAVASQHYIRLYVDGRQILHRHFLVEPVYESLWEFRIKAKDFSRVKRYRFFGGMGGENYPITAYEEGTNRAMLVRAAKGIIEVWKKPEPPWRFALQDDLNEVDLEGNPTCVTYFFNIPVGQQGAYVAFRKAGKNGGCVGDFTDLVPFSMRKIYQRYGD